MEECLCLYDKMVNIKGI